MTEEEFRADLLASAASRAEVQSCRSREAFATEVLERLSEAGEVPDSEPCPEILTGHRGRRLELDAWAFDDADDSLHFFICLIDGRPQYPVSLSLSEARDYGFNRLLGVFEQARDGWLSSNIEESRPLWHVARQIQTRPLPSTLRLHVLTDRPVSERLREISEARTSQKVPITFQIWDVTRLKRIHDAKSVRDDLVVDLCSGDFEGVPILPASVGSGDYDAYLAVIPGELLAEIYLQHGSRLLEGNVRTFLGRSGKVNKGISGTITKEPEKFFAYNNGVAATASEITTKRGGSGQLLLTAASDLQIVNGAQTTASLAAALRDGSLVRGTVFVPLKLSVVSPALGAELIPLISRFSNSQNGVRASDFFANHAFHRRIEEISRRLLSKGRAGSQIQTHWYYERARGQYLNDQAVNAGTKRSQFMMLYPRSQIIKKTDLAKVECCFNLEPDVACKGAEKAFVAFAERISKEWEDEGRRLLYGDDWFRSAVARIILFRTTESLVSKAAWYEGGYRAQIVAYTCGRLAQLACEQEGRGGLDFIKIWNNQAAGTILEQQINLIGQSMAQVLLKPPSAGQNVSEWAKQQACRSTAMNTKVAVVEGFSSWVISRADLNAQKREQKTIGSIDSGLDSVKAVLANGAGYWEALRAFCSARQIMMPEDEKALYPACRIPKMVPTDRQAARLLELANRATEAGWSL
jgi:hypothetical protein